MNFPAVLTVSATLPFFATYLAEADENADADSLLSAIYFAAIGLLVSFAALLDDQHDLTPCLGSPPIAGFSPGAACHEASRPK
jgi:hypothetical protein